ncbi:DUF2382 domain-containing protein [Chamaesiphon sp. VAR_69_metabat_338]|uniref:DUF2382 domain-containing protein n=1 Tax=Chamaesiphon sp. VAR_69_metabat_338 TaxID=2964704 RepID=UPI00286DE9E6|nr:DUF2382 domain-containing protein [Chamaesiphon sp. VAR_69_metabat_338]
MILDRSRDNQPQPTSVTSTNVLTEDIIYLLEERLMVDLTRHKTGEIVVRKEVETQTLHVEVPVRREKLIVEQVSPEYKLLAQVDLGRSEIGGTPAFVNHDEAILVSAQPKQLPLDRVKNGTRTRELDEPNTVSGTVNTPQAAIDLLTALGQLAEDDIQAVRIEIALTERTNRDRYQAIFNRSSGEPESFTDRTLRERN